MRLCSYLIIWTLSQKVKIFTKGIIVIHRLEITSRTITYAWGQFIVSHRMHSYRHTALSEISNRFWGKILLRTVWYHGLFFFRCGVYKYCCSVYGTVWCKDEVQSANCVRTMEVNYDDNSQTVTVHVLNHFAQWSGRFVLQVVTRSKGIYNQRC